MCIRDRSTQSTWGSRVQGKTKEMSQYLDSLMSDKNLAETAATTFLQSLPSAFVRYHIDRLSVTYTGDATEDSSIFVCQTTKPLNKDVLIAYFEVEIVAVGQRQLHIGFGENDFPINKLPGRTRSSYGCKADGSVWIKKVKQDESLPEFQNGDVIGVGLNYYTRELFFTRNGEQLPALFKNIELKEFYPTIGLNSPHESISLNMGRTPFKFDIQAMRQKLKSDVIASVMETETDSHELHKCIQNYLVHSGYGETLQAFETSSRIHKNKPLLPPLIEYKDIDDKKQSKTKSLFRLLSLTLLNAEKASRSDDGDQGEDELENIFGLNLLHRALFRRRDDDIIVRLINHYHSSDGRDAMEEEDSQMAEEGSVATNITTNNNNARGSSSNPNTSSSNNNKEEESKELEIETSKNEEEEKGIEESAADLAEELDKVLRYSLMRIERESEGPMIRDDAADIPEYERKFLFHTRSRVREMIREGKIQEAMQSLNRIEPQLLISNKNILNDLLVMHFVNLVMNGSMFEAIQFAQENLHERQEENFDLSDGKGGSIVKTVESVLGILCYEDPKKSEFANLFSVAQVDLIADLVNKEILNSAKVQRRGYDQSVAVR
eukprot:TRINITY_DN3941_c0_g1_i7.p1 TRINITY_DN3941_c0_g1~~TRINITY_DN3941_c0_g1_i7.p1  ORF type:complete len:606 (+),score=124.52 TRINITY_DN3941_c0_g1_i7:81-1898(+)